jgi:hypothetical protein
MKMASLLKNDVNLRAGFVLDSGCKIYHEGVFWLQFILTKFTDFHNGY